MTAETEFRHWFIESLAPLRGTGNEGFVFLLVAFPLLERYLRRKAGCPDGYPLTDAFFSQLGVIFSELNGHERQFWSCYRDGLLHHVTFPQARLHKKTQQWRHLPAAGISGHDPRPTYFLAASNEFYVNPITFFDAVTNLILSDFATYAGGDTSIYSLPSVLDPLGAIHGVVPTINFNLYRNEPET
jgi:hypothetical protein